LHETKTKKGIPKTRNKSWFKSESDIVLMLKGTYRVTDQGESQSIVQQAISPYVIPSNDLVISRVCVYVAQVMYTSPTSYPSPQFLMKECFLIDNDE
jgi:hypothetical protein